MASWLVRSSLNLVVWVGTLAFKAIVLCFWARHLTLAAPLSMHQGVQILPAILMLVVTLR